jgi:malonate decarboxylase epsilon subunit
VIAGTDEGMAQAASALAKGASKAKRLAVSVPSHCALLADRRKSWRRRLNRSRFHAHAAPT